MTNTAMPIPAILAPSPAPAARQSDAPAPEKPFNQVLSKEVADRRQKNAAMNDAPAPAKQSEPANRSAPSDADASAKSTAAHSVKADKTAKEDKPEEKQDTEDGTAGTVPTALLEMVASLAHRSAQAAPAADAHAANTGNASRLGGDPHSAKGAKAGGRQAPGFGSDPAAAIAAHANEKGEAPHSAKAEAALHKAVLSATEAKPAHQSVKATEAAAQPIGMPNLPSTAAPLAANALEHAQASGNRLAPPVGTPAWGQALGQKVAWMVTGAEQSATLSLNPPDLGPLQVVLNVSHAQADATFTSAQPEVRQALEAALPKLRDMLSEAGIQLGQASVNAGTPQQQGEFGRPPHSSSRSSAAADDAAAPIATASRTVSRIGMVDTFA